MGLIEKACPPKLVIEEVEQRKGEIEEKIEGLSHIGIDDVDQLIKQPLAIEGNIYVYIHIWHKLAKNELEDHKCNAQLRLEYANHPHIGELLEIWKIWRDFLGY